MPRPNRFSPQHPIRFSSAIVSALVGLFLLLPSCAPLTSQTRSAPDHSQTQRDQINQKIDTIYHRLSVMQFMLDNHERALQKLQGRGQASSSQDLPDETRPSPDKTAAGQAKKSARAQAAVSAPPSETPKTLYQSAIDHYRQQRFDPALAKFTQFAQKFPDHDLADNALYWAGECHYSNKKFEAAVQRFKQLLRDYPEGNKKPDALLKIGYAYLMLDDTVNAQMYLKNVIRNFPFSDAAAKAKNKLETLN